MNKTERFVLILIVLLLLSMSFGGSLVEPVEDIPPERTESTEQIPVFTEIPIVTATPEPTPTPTPEVQYYTDEEVVMVAKVLYDECRGIASDTEKACVVWTICNRVDAGYGATISHVVTASGQFAYRSNAPVWSELYTLAEDVLIRWNHEKNGVSDVGRVLPRDYLWYSGDGYHNYFRNSYGNMNGYWNYSYESPYNS